MAGLQRKGDSWDCTFRYQGERFTFTVGNVPDSVAQDTGSGVDLLLYRLKNRLIEIPSGISVVDFVQFGGDLNFPLAESTQQFPSYQYCYNYPNQYYCYLGGSRMTTKTGSGSAVP